MRVFEREVAVNSHLAELGVIRDGRGEVVDVGHARRGRDVLGVAHKAGRAVNNCGAVPEERVRKVTG